MTKDLILMPSSHITHDLSRLSWRLSGWQPQSWLRPISMELGIDIPMDVSPVAAHVPGSVQQALYNAGLVPDWNTGLQSRQCEWVENRHWVFETTLPVEWAALPGRKRLRCAGLDYRGAVFVNGTEAGTFCGSMAAHIFDLTMHLKSGDNKLRIVFNGVPDYLGQLCWTSRIKDWKPRFNYGWDWTPRLVQIGIWDAIQLEIDHGDCFESVGLFTDYSSDSGLGTVTIDGQLTIATATHVEIVLRKGAEIINQETIPATNHLVRQFRTGPVTSWQPNGNGLPTLYHLQINLLDAAGTVLDSTVRRIGFRQIEWKPCAGAPADALPWVCNINGVDTFLQGFNWVPIRSNFADVTVAEYRQRLETYRAMGTNLLRVWGGAVLERECFYDLCDEMGLLVWQEFPLSSSGIDNWPPEEADVISEMKTIATGYIQRRQHHPSLLLWCGGNELQGSLDGSKVGTGKPVDLSHPMLRMLGELVGLRDPTRRFLPTSSFGPRFMAAKEDFGKGIHHDVHGPWNHTEDMAGWFDYWNHDDALFRSETGMPGASSADLIRTFGRNMAWPANRTNPYWMHVCSWWVQWKEYIAAAGDPASLDAYVQWSQTRQATALAHAANACKSRFPACGGILIWMGHDAFPCPANTSVIDFLGRRKPAADALAIVFLNNRGSALSKGTSNLKDS